MAAYQTSYAAVRVIVSSVITVIQTVYRDISELADQIYLIELEGKPEPCL